MKVSDYMDELKKAFEDIVQNNKAIEKAVKDQNIGISGFNEILDRTKNESVGVSDEDFKESFRYLLNSDNSERFTVWGDVARGTIVQLLKETPVSEFVGKYKEYKKKVKEDSGNVKVGDEITNGVQFIVITYIYDENWYGVDSNGEGYTCRKIEGWKKTGRHFYEVETLLSKLKEGAE